MKKDERLEVLSTKIAVGRNATLMVLLGILGVLFAASITEWKLSISVAVVVAVLVAIASFNMNVAKETVSSRVAAWYEKDEERYQEMRRERGRACALYLQEWLAVWENTKSVEHPLDPKCVAPGLWYLADEGRQVTEENIKYQQLILTGGRLGVSRDDAAEKEIQERSATARGTFWSTRDELVRSGLDEVEWVSKVIKHWRDALNLPWDLPASLGGVNRLPTVN